MTIADLFVSSVVLSAAYTLIALGWVLVFRASKTFNFATGEFIVLGTYFAFWLTITLGVPAGLGIPLALVLVAVLGVGVYFVLLRPLVGRPLFVPVILTLGVAISIESVIRLIWGPANRIFRPPFKDAVINLPGGAVTSTVGVGLVVLTVVVLLGLLSLFKWTKLGLQMRAAAEQPVLASQSGIPVNVIFATGWFLAVAVAGLAGIGFAYQTALTPAIAVIGLRGIAPAIIGGFDSVGGAAVGAVIVAFIESALVYIVGPEAREAAAWLVLLVVLLVRPNGLFGDAALKRV